MKKAIALLLTFSSLCLFLTACSGQSDTDSASGNAVTAADVEAAVAGMDFTFKDCSEDESLTGTALDLSALKSNATVGGSPAYTLTKGGNYVLSGSLKDCMLVINAPDSDVTLIMNGAEIANTKGPAVYCQDADTLKLVLKKGTENTLSDGSKYTATDGDTAVDATLFSRADTIISGTGSLTVSGNAKHGLVSKDDFVLYSGTVTVKAANVGVNGKDCIKMNEGTLTVDAGSDALRSDNEEDETKGFVYLNKPTLTLTAGNDGIQAQTVIYTEAPTLTVKAGGGSSATLENSDESYKALKADSDIIINGGKITADSLDDCLHTATNLTLKGGDLALSSGDDGIHADGILTVAGGTVTVSKSYEGLEATTINITGGKVNVTSSDDGYNAAGGNDSSATGHGPGKDMFGSDSSQYAINISGGYAVINAQGDGIDSNGTITVSGGITLISGPTSGGDAAFDYESSGKVTGGILVSLGSNGMAENFTESENQGAFLTSFDSQKANSSFAVTDESGNVVVSFTPAKNYESALITAPEIKDGATYKLMSGMTVTGADENGYAHNAKGTGGTEITSVTMDGDLTGEGFGGQGGFGGKGGGQQPPEGFSGEMPSGMEPPSGFDGTMPEGMTPPSGFDGTMPEGMSRPEGMEPPTGEDGRRQQPPDGFGKQSSTTTTAKGA